MSRTPDARSAADVDVVVIGGGVAGLSTAAALQRGDRRAVLFEALPDVGGACHTFHEDGFTVDLGPPLLLDTSGLEEAFDVAGGALRRDVTLVEVEPALGVVFPDWERVTLHRDADRTARELERLHVGDGDRWLGLLDYLARAAADLEAVRRDPPRSGLRAALAADRLRRPLFWSQSLQAFLASWLGGARARIVAAAPLLLEGADPDAVPATALGVLRDLHQGGAWQALGGSGAVAAALARRVRAAGVEVRTGSPVAGLIVSDGRVAGVRLEGGETVTARAVVSTLHVGATFHELLADVAPARRGRAAADRMALAGAPFQVVFGFEGPDEPDVSVQFYWPPEQERDDALSALRGREDVYLKGLPMSFSCPSVADPDAAPDGDLVVGRALVPMPHRHALADWRRLRERAADEAIAFADSRFLPGMRERVVWRGVFTPQTLSGRLRLWRRSLAPALTLGQRGHQRAPLRAAGVRGLYLAGRSAHPGTSPSDTARSGLAAARAVAADLQGLPDASRPRTQTPE